MGYANRVGYLASYKCERYQLSQYENGMRASRHHEIFNQHTYLFKM